MSQGKILTMKNLKLFFCCALLVQLLMSSCSKEDPECDPFVADLFSLEEIYACTNTLFDMSLSGDEVQLIKDQATFEQNIGGGCIPTIDFDTYDLLIGRVDLTNGFDDVSYNLWSPCDEEKYIFDINIQLNDTDIAPSIVYHALVHKLETTLEIDFIINLN